MEYKKINFVDKKHLLIGITTDPNGWKNPLIFIMEDIQNDKDE